MSGIVIEPSQLFDPPVDLVEARSVCSVDELVLSVEGAGLVGERVKCLGGGSLVETKGLDDILGKSNLGVKILLVEVRLGELGGERLDVIMEDLLDVAGLEVLLLNLSNLSSTCSMLIWLNSSLLLSFTLYFS